MLLNPYALRAIRERSGLTLTELGRLAGVSQPHLSNLERGQRRASPATVRRLAGALKVPVPAILADVSSDEPHVAERDGTAGSGPPTPGDDADPAAHPGPEASGEHLAPGPTADGGRRRAQRRAPDRGPTGSLPRTERAAMHQTIRTSRPAAVALAALGLGAIVATPAPATAATGPDGAPPGPTEADGGGGVDTYVVRYDVTQTTLDGAVVDHDAGAFEVTPEQLAAGVHLDGAALADGATGADVPAGAAVVGSPSPWDEGCRSVTVGYTSATDYPWGRQTYWTYRQSKHFCWHHSAGFVDQLSWNQYVTDLDPFFYPRENNQSANYVAAWGPSAPKSGHHSRTQWRIENCVPVYGCVSSRSPWAWITVYADGNWAADAGT